MESFSEGPIQYTGRNEDSSEKKTLQISKYERQTLLTLNTLLVIMVNVQCIDKTKVYSTWRYGYFGWHLC